jgi:hypothetical protein
MKVPQVLLATFLAFLALCFLILCFLGVIDFAVEPIAGPRAPILFNALFFVFPLWGSIALFRRGAGPRTAKAVKIVFGILLGLLTLIMAILFAILLNEGPAKTYVPASDTAAAKPVWLGIFLFYWLTVIAGSVFLFVSSFRKKPNSTS